MKFPSLFAFVAFAISSQFACAASYDCNKASGPVEHLICSDQELSADDDVIATLYKAALARTHSDPKLVDGQRAWIARRNSCRADPDMLTQCVMNSYSERKDELNRAAPPPPAEIRPTPSAPQNQQPFDEVRRQRIEDARAMVRESWEGSAETIRAVIVAYKCDLVDQLSASIAIQHIEVSMRQELFSAGLGGDPTMLIEPIRRKAVGDGIANAENGACSRLSPADRGRLRAFVGALMN